MKVLEILKNNKRLVLTGVIIGEVIFAGYLWYKAGIKASKVIKEKEEDLSLCDPSDKEAIKTVKFEATKKMIPVALPPVLVTSLTVGTIIFSHKINEKDILVLSSAYALTRDKLKVKEEKILELFGEKKAKEIDGAIMKDNIANIDEGPGEIILTKYGDTACYDCYSGREFTSSPTRIQQAILELSSRLQNEMWIPLNDFYYLIGLDSVKMGNDLGFKIEDTIRGQIPITTSAILNKYNQPVFTVDFDVSIRERYLLEARL